MAGKPKSKVVKATGAAVGLRGGLEAAKRIEAAMVKAIEGNPRRPDETQAQYDKRLRAAIREARDEAIG